MKKGKILTVEQFKNLKDDDYFHLEYYDDEGQLRTNGIKQFFPGSRDATKDGYTIYLDRLNPSKLIHNIDNSGWKFTIYEVIK